MQFGLFILEEGEGEGIQYALLLPEETGISNSHLRLAQAAQ